MAENKLSIRPFYLLTNNRGMNQKDGLFFLQPDAAEAIENLHVSRTGHYSNHEQGNSTFASALSAGRVDTLDFFRDAAGDRHMIAACNGAIYHLNPDTGEVVETIATANTAGNTVDVQAFKGVAYLAEQTMNPLVWTGSGAASAVAAFPLTLGDDTYEKPRLVETFANRLIYANFAGSNAFPSHLAISDTLDPETFTFGVADSNGAIIQVNPGDGDQLSALKTVYIPALDQNYLVCFKEHATYALTGNTPETFEVIRLSGDFGCLNNQCVTQVGSDLFFLDADNLYSLTTATQSGTLQPRIVGSDMVRDTLKRLNVSQKDKAWIKHFAFRQEVWVGIPTGASTEVDTILVYRYPIGVEELPVWSLRKGMTATTMAALDTAVYSGATDGSVQRWFTASQYEGTGFAWQYRYPYFNFGTQGQNKRVVELFAWMFVRSLTEISVQCTWRGGGDNTAKTIARTVSQQDAAVFGSAVFGSDVYSAAEGTLVKVKVPVYGNGEQLQLAISGTTGSVGVDFLGFSGLVEYLDFSRSYK